METKFTENQFEEFEKYEVLSDQDIFTKIWTKPRKVFKFINDTQYEKYMYILLFFAGVARAFDRATSKNMGDNSSLLTIVLGAVVLGGALGWISYYIYAALLSWTGKWLNGVANTSSIFRMIAYAVFPSVLALIFLVPQMAIYGIDVFRDADYTSAGTFGNVLFWTSAFIQIALSITTLVLMVIGLSEVQKFSVGKAILNLILPIAVIIVPILLIASMFWLL
ncbi:hypothetical protein CHRY9390_02201 [Chryseobacterium aquaeductus]|uniref:Yip1 domain-containing protein n=1 Tax=Chryseobacterium aquaeductus TaxID=2675056 RepID=A0A9N8QSW2_9FLAO|nr:Yip1 family protein [Chryseobacterium aquaeductus]CAA7331499.1 hypothetical protein CHRY9390_02201 [Chryseobacterium potabilaquae]CAD7810568.1 hypothetical protein CHRY9390_02201 [Chryseobacterium aquaeductus]